MRALRSCLFLLLMLLCQTAFAAKGTILYVPMDNRPVCLDYTVQSMQSAGWDVQVPPREIIADATTPRRFRKIIYLAGRKC